MKNTLASVKGKVRSLVGDPFGDFCTDDYLTPLINVVYEDQTTELMATTGSSFDEWVFDVPGVPAGTPDLSAYQAQDMATPNGNVSGPLYGLLEPDRLEWKQGGQPDSSYARANRTAVVPNVSPGTFNRGDMAWEWRTYTLYVTPMSFTVDLRVRGEFSPPELLRNSDVLIVHPRMSTAVAYAAAALIGAERQNEGWQKYEAEAASVLENIAAMMVRAEQGAPVRIGRR